MERAQAKAQAEAELTYVRLCEYCGRSAFKSNVAYGYHKRRCFDQLCAELAAAAGASSALKVRLRVNGTQHELLGPTARGRKRPGAEAGEGVAPGGDDAPRLVRASLLVGRQCPSTKLRDTYRGGSHGGGEGLVSLELSVLLKPRQRKVAKRFSEEAEAEAPTRPPKQPRAEAPRAAASSAPATATAVAADVVSVSCELDVDTELLEGEALDRRPAEGGRPCGGVAAPGGPSLFVAMRGGVRLAVSSELELPFPVYLNPQLFQPGYKPPREPRAAEAAAAHGKRARPSARPSAAAARGAAARGAAARGAAAGAAASDAVVEAVQAEAEAEGEGEPEAEVVSVEVPSPAFDLGGRGERGHPFAAAAVARVEAKPRPRRPAFGLGAKPAFKLPRPPRPPARAGLQCEAVAWRLRGAGRCFASAIVVGAAVEARCGVDT